MFWHNSFVRTQNGFDFIAPFSKKLDLWFQSNSMIMAKKFQFHRIIDNLRIHLPIIPDRLLRNALPPYILKSLEWWQHFSVYHSRWFCERKLWVLYYVSRKCFLWRSSWPSGNWNFSVFKSWLHNVFSDKHYFCRIPLWKEIWICYWNWKAICSDFLFDKESNG